MELSKTFNVSVDYRNPKCSLNWESHLFIEAVFIDKTHSASRPIVYQLNNHALDANIWQLSSPNFLQEAFTLIGEAVSIDKKKKKILLDNKSTISYNYLVTLSGSKSVLTFQDKEFQAALHALVEAIRVKPKIFSSFPFPQKRHSPLIRCQAKSKSGEKSMYPTPSYLEKIVHLHLSSAKQPHICREFSAANKRLYEVQL